MLSYLYEQIFSPCTLLIFLQRSMGEVEREKNANDIKPSILLLNVEYQHFVVCNTFALLIKILTYLFLY